ncbi:hypothetical protein BJX63DRAFT_402415 [Aspergillus granulosus]|uniref:Uncharacterized protein n=1 Tax=Aspergillus granulosus TaxID=176169 RepID=A0ABR4H4G9_9EURO
MAGLIFQVIMLFGFIGLLGDFVFRFLSSKTSSSIDTRAKLFFGFLFLALFTTLARCIFRADELKEGYSGELISNEGLFIGLEGVLIVIAVFALCIGHPGFIFRKDGEHEYSSVDNLEMR